MGFPDTALGREMGARYSQDKPMTKKQKQSFMNSGEGMLHEKASDLAKDAAAAKL